MVKEFPFVAMETLALSLIHACNHAVKVMARGARREYCCIPKHILLFFCLFAYPCNSDMRSFERFSTLHSANIRLEHKMKERPDGERDAICFILLIKGAGEKIRKEIRSFKKCRKFKKIKIKKKRQHTYDGGFHFDPLTLCSRMRMLISPHYPIIPLYSIWQHRL